MRAGSDVAFRCQFFVYMRSGPDVIVLILLCPFDYMRTGPDVICDASSFVSMCIGQPQCSAIAGDDASSAAAPWSVVTCEGRCSKLERQIPAWPHARSRFYLYRNLLLLPALFADLQHTCKQLGECLQHHIWVSRRCFIKEFLARQKPNFLVDCPHPAPRNFGG